MTWSDQAARAQTARRHSKVASILLNKNVRSDFGSSKQRMLALAIVKSLFDAVRRHRIGIVPTGGQLLKPDSIGGIALHFVRREMKQRGFRTMPPHTFKQVQRPGGLDIEIIERPLCGAIMARLSGCMN